MEDYAQLLKLLQGQQEEPKMSEEVASVDPALQAPEEIETIAGAARGIASAESQPVVSDIETQKANQDAKSPNMKTKQELMEDQQQSPADMLRAEIARAQGQREQKPKELSWGDRLPDILAGAHNILNYGQGSLQKNMDLGYADRLQKQRANQRKLKQSESKNIQDMMVKLANIEKKKEKKITSALDQAKAEKVKAETAALKAKKPEPTWEEKEIKKMELKQKLVDDKTRKKEIKTTKEAISNVDEQIEKVRRAKKLLKDITKGSAVADTGPLDQYITGTTGKGQKLRQAFNDLSLNKMTKMFKGMSKAIDSDAERKMFEQSQASLSNYPDVNEEILDNLEKALLSTKDKNLRYMQEDLEQARPDTRELEAQPMEVRRKTKDGKVAVFDAETKEFLRYEE
jgi:hypothetical protein